MDEEVEEEEKEEVEEKEEKEEKGDLVVFSQCSLMNWP